MPVERLEDFLAQQSSRRKQDYLDWCESGQIIEVLCSFVRAARGASDRDRGLCATQQSLWQQLGKMAESSFVVKAQAQLPHGSNVYRILIAAAQEAALEEKTFDTRKLELDQAVRAIWSEHSKTELPFREWLYVAKATFQEVPALARARVPVALYQAAEHQGDLAWLTVELLPHAPAACAAHPRHLLKTRITDAFDASIRRAWLACGEFSRFPQILTARWSLDFLQPHESEKDGAHQNSISAAAAYAFLYLLQQRPVESGLLVIGAVDTAEVGAQLIPVDDSGVQAKVLAAAEQTEQVLVLGEETGWQVDRVAVIGESNARFARAGLTVGRRTRIDVVRLDEEAVAGDSSAVGVASIRNLLRIRSQYQERLTAYLQQVQAGSGRDCSASAGNHDVVTERTFLVPVIQREEPPGLTREFNDFATEAVKHQWRLAITGEAGTGKTTLLRELAARFAAAGEPQEPGAEAFFAHECESGSERISLGAPQVPVWVDAVECAEFLDEQWRSGGRPIEALSRYFECGNWGRNFPRAIREWCPEIWRRAWAEGRVILLVDRVDELLARESPLEEHRTDAIEFLTLLRRLVADPAEAGRKERAVPALVVALRTAGANRLKTLDLPRYRLLPWQPDQARRYLQKRVHACGRESDRLAADVVLARAEELFTYLGYFHGFLEHCLTADVVATMVTVAAQEECPDRTAAFAEALLARGEERWREFESAGDSGRIRQVARLALGSMAQLAAGETGELSTTELRDVVRDFANHLAAFSTRWHMQEDDVVALVRDEILLCSGALVEVSPGLYRWRLPPWRDRLARDYLRQARSDEPASEAPVRLPAAALTLDEESFARARAHLRAMLERMDLPADWNPARYSPIKVLRLSRRGSPMEAGELEALVLGYFPEEMNRLTRGWHKLKKRLRGTPLRLPNRLFLLTGDPGGGKSLALQEFARKLTGEAVPYDPVHWRLPLYLNLREWSEAAWNGASLFSVRDCPPKEEVARSLTLFALRKLQGDPGLHFLAANFEALRQENRWFFLLDSFDEIPALLRAEDQGELMNALSDGIRYFLEGGQTLSRGGGMVASRDFRRPTRSFTWECSVLQLQPFGDDSVRQFLASQGVPERVCTAFYERYPDLALVARNPFTAVLLSDYLHEYGNAVAAGNAECSRATLYSHSMESKISAAALRLEQVEMPLPARYLREELARLAAVLFDHCSPTSSGFELPTNQFGEGRLHTGQRPIVLRALQESGILRWRDGSPRFSFSHRCFAEYFASLTLERSGGRRLLGELGAVNSPWRGAAVIYGQRAELPTLQAIVEECWQGVAPVLADATATRDQLREAMFVLGFLLEATRGRPESVAAHQEEICQFICRVARNPRKRLIEIRQAAELTGLLSDEPLDRALNAQLVRGDWWSVEAAIHACRFHQEPSWVLSQRLWVLLESMPVTALFRRDGLVAALENSRGLQMAAKIVQWRRWDLGQGLVGLILFAFHSKGEALVTATLCAMWWSIRRGERQEVPKKVENENSTSRGWSDASLSILYLGSFEWLMRIGLCYWVFKTGWPEYVKSEAALDAGYGGYWPVTASLFFIASGVLLFPAYIFRFLTHGVTMLLLGGIAIVVGIAMGFTLLLLIFGAAQKSVRLLGLNSAQQNILVCLVFIAGTAVAALSHFKDSVKLKEFQKTYESSRRNEIQRSEIDELFFSIRSHWFQDRLLKLLEERKVPWVGSWPEESLVGTMNDIVNQRLNVLDQYWLEYERRTRWSRVRPAGKE